MVIRSKDNLFEDLDPLEAARRFGDDPSSVVFSLTDVMRVFDVSKDELLDDLRAGRLTAHGIPNGNSYRAIHIRGDNLVAWATLTRRKFKSPRMH